MNQKLPCRWCSKLTSQREIEKVGGSPCHQKCRVRPATK